jgi:hypothetical protein
MIGSNDFCADICYQPNPEKVLTYHDKYLTSALRTIRDNLPRTMVNIVTPPTVKVLLDFVGKPDECVTVHLLECPCMFASQFRSQRKRFLKIMRKWHDVQNEVVNREEFHNRTVSVGCYFYIIVIFKFIFNFRTLQSTYNLGPQNFSFPGMRTIKLISHTCQKTVST